jgi:K(+)-stimulated pyrophosphate-energized sodium pump
VYLTGQQGATLTHVLALAFFVVAAFFVRRSFYGMRIEGAVGDKA